MAVRSANIMAARGKARLSSLLPLLILESCCRRHTDLTRAKGHGQDDPDRKGPDDYCECTIRHAVKQSYSS